MTLLAKTRTSSSPAAAARYDRPRVRAAILRLLNEPRLASAVLSEVRSTPTPGPRGASSRETAQAALQARVRFKASGTG